MCIDNINRQVKVVVVHFILLYVLQIILLYSRDVDAESTNTFILKQNIIIKTMNKIQQIEEKVNKRG